MGGNTYNRKYYTDEELTVLINKIDGLKSLFDDRIFENKKLWRANISRHLDADSCNRFYFKIKEKQGLPICPCCGVTLGIDSFNYISAKNFTKYCFSCTKKGMWRYVISYNKETLKERGRKITESKKKFYQTDRGKEVAQQIGEKNSIAVKRFHQSEEGKILRKQVGLKLSNIMKQSILSGKFTPNSNNRNTHWESEYNGKKYRSSWEALYQFHFPLAQYEKLRIKYFFQEKEHIYIIDFIDEQNKIVVEVKPEELVNDNKTQAKINALKSWAIENNYIFQLYGIKDLIKLPEPDYNLFDIKTHKKIKKIYAQAKN